MLAYSVKNWYMDFHMVSVANRTDLSNKQELPFSLESNISSKHQVFRCIWTWFQVQKRKSKIKLFSFENQIHFSEISSNFLLSNPARTNPGWKEMNNPLINPLTSAISLWLHLIGVERCCWCHLWYAKSLAINDWLIYIFLLIDSALRCCTV